MRSPDLQAPGASRRLRGNDVSCSSLEAPSEAAATQGRLPSPAARWPGWPTPVQATRIGSDACTNDAPTPIARRCGTTPTQRRSAEVEQRLSLVTLGVADLARSVAFYGRLGWTPANDWLAQEVAFFQLQSLVLALWDREALAADSGTVAAPPGAVTLAWNAGAPDEVDATLAEARAAGAHVARPGAPTDWGGYSGVFHDPDGHAWEVAHNPHWRIDAAGGTHLG